MNLLVSAYFRTFKEFREGKSDIRKFAPIRTVLVLIGDIFFVVLVSLCENIYAEKKILKKLLLFNMFVGGGGWIIGTLMWSPSTQ